MRLPAMASIVLGPRLAHVLRKLLDYQIAGRRQECPANGTPGKKETAH